MTASSLSEIMEDLKFAKANLERIRTTYGNNADLLNFYEPSAKYLVESLESQIAALLHKEVACNFIPSDKSADLWIRIDGEQFHNGKGPIGLVGSFLNKLNNASKHAVELIAKSKQIDLKSDFMDFSGSFDLASTAQGSLKLGLKKPDIIVREESQQIDLFTFDKDPWDELKASGVQNEIVVESMNLLLSAIASAENEEIFEELTKEYNEKEVLKIIHYAKQVVPSAQSNIDTISFEIENLNVKQRRIDTTKETRKLLTKQARRLIPNKEFITGKGKVRGIDLDDKSLIVRPLEYDDIKHDEIRCYFVNPLEENELEDYLDKNVELSGFIVFSSNNRLLRLEIEDIKFELEFDKS
ncbi:hypothetical protein V3851_18335 [Paenibacillus sp. M1]|uniref:Uncharacterized protein n=1 Tax=Paenibacillus haidiansis TaxID=1574488 RepID=A0ABU7VVJ6_9BACL